MQNTKSFVLISRIGCLLPLLIIFNLFFGLLFLTFFVWLLVETILVSLFLVQSFWITRKIIAKSSGTGRDKIIDVEGTVVGNEKKSLPKK